MESETGNPVSKFFFRIKAEVHGVSCFTAAETFFNMIEYFLLHYTQNGNMKRNISISSSDLSKSHEVLQLPDERKHDATGDSLVHTLVRVSFWFVSFASKNNQTSLVSLLR